MRCVVLAAAAVALLVACHPAALSRVPESEAAAFERCVKHPDCSSVMCGGTPTSKDPIASFGWRGCVENHASEYANLASRPERREYLLKNGCPAAMLRELE